MVTAHTAIAFWHHFPPQILKNMDLETVSHFATQNHRKSPKCVQSGSQEAPQIHLKIDKTGPLGLNVPIDRSKHLRGPPPRCLECPGYPKWSLKVSKMTVLGIKSDPFRQVSGTRYQVPGTWYQVPGTRYQTRYQVPGTRYQLICHLLTGGPAAGAKP